MHILGQPIDWSTNIEKKLRVCCLRRQLLFRNIKNARFCSEILGNNHIKIWENPSLPMASRSSSPKANSSFLLEGKEFPQSILGPNLSEGKKAV